MFGLICTTMSFGNLPWRDVMTAKIVTVTPEDDLNTALARFTQRNLDELPIVDPQNPSRLLGMLRRKDTIALYNRQVMEHKQAIEEVSSDI